MTKKFGSRDIASAELTNVIQSLEKGHIGEIPSHVKWSNSRIIDPTRNDSCIHFAEASKGDILSSLPLFQKDMALH